MDSRNEILFASKPCISIHQLHSEFMILFFTVSFFFSQTHPVTLQQPQDFCSTDFLVFCVFLFFLEFYLLNKFLLFMYFYFEYQVHIKKKQHSDFFTGHYFF